MYKIRYSLFIILCLFISGHVYASKASSPVSDKTVMRCSVGNYNEFIAEVIQNPSRQREMVKYPLEYISIVKSGDHYKPYGKLLTSSDITFPIIESGSRFTIDRIDDEARLGLQPDKFEISVNSESFKGDYVSLFFDKSKCWDLVRVENWTWPSSMSSAWLMNLFPRINACVPNRSYYDVSKRESYNGFMEKRGYKTFETNDSSAKYKITERFYDLDATELSIAVYDSVFTVMVQAPVSKLASNIKLYTGFEPKISSGDSQFKVESGVAYLVGLDSSHSMFVCYSFEE